ncbi:Trp biosynthesis-associated membrane protein [Micromonospora echinofusca]|uniref:Trp biosynthesis protein n=1 Tax=Micromonospora echinofusca TaxID=47858 RepID=A0ABS3W0D0_MICEH|nr:Trp biosynthesis-associated membrane protein [Micromonospora echinofusca]MBO4210247.1 Trp biosynthesis protein [Micromonospora echinofusca]
MTGPDGDRPDPGRRQLAYAVLLCLAGAGLALFATTRTWVVELVDRPAPLPAIRQARTGAALLPWVSALAVVGLAGAGAVLATRGLSRRLVGVLLLLVGVLLVVGGGSGLVSPPAGAVSHQWPAFCLLGGVLVAVGGVWTVRSGNRWPVMGARYERRERPDAPVAGTGRPAGDRPGTTQAWDALDRGEDPTVG